MKKQKHLVMSGSGTLFPYFIGAIKRLLKEDIEFKSITGSSGGSFVGALLASGITISEIEKLVLSKPLYSFVDYSWNPFNGIGLLKGDQIYLYMKQVLSSYNKHILKDTKIPLNIVTTNLSKEYNTDRVSYFTSSTTPNMDIALAVRASMSIPLLFKYVIIDEEIYVDGGISNNFPLNFVPENESQDIIGLKMDTSFSSQRKFLPPNSILNIDIFKLIKSVPNFIIDYILSLIDTFMNTLEREHIKDSVYSKVIYIKSSHSNSNGFFSHSFDDIKNMINKGYSETDDWLKSNSI